MSDIKEIKPHPNGAEYVIEDIPALPTPKNRVSAILMNWMIKSINRLDEQSYEYGNNENGFYRKYADGRLVMGMGFVSSNQEEFKGYVWRLPHSVGFSSIGRARLDTFATINISPEVDNSTGVATNRNSASVESFYLQDFVSASLNMFALPEIRTGRKRYYSIIVETRWK